MTNKILSALFLTIMVFAVAGCNKNKIDEESITPAGQLYQNGVSLLQKKKYTKAALEFEKIFFQHPGKEITAYSELMQAYSLYLAEKYDEAIDILEIFIGLHPRHPDLSYAYYLIALSNYNQIAEVELDQSYAQNAMEIFEEIINRFPDSKYALDASLKIDLTKDQLAAKEMMVGRYYQSKNNPIPAIARYQNVISKYKRTAHVPEALYRLVEASYMLGLTDEAKRYQDFLQHNYPNSSWVKLAARVVSK